ncbi:helix-turn-helix domain-containing protein [Anaerococcus obesiensis]|uniref:helix-turn-helix domain-containing protein n=1 Tax=Anaerococcus obesiensis TaxID=1287640 RepID=UPI0039946D0E
MINVNKLKAIFVENGKNQKDVAKMLGISENTMSIKLKKGILNSDEIFKLIDIFEIKNPTDIFFVNDVTLEETKEN